MDREKTMENKLVQDLLYSRRDSTLFVATREKQNKQFVKYTSFFFFLRNFTYYGILFISYTSPKRRRFLCDRNILKNVTSKHWRKK